MAVHHGTKSTSRNHDEPACVLPSEGSRLMRMSMSPQCDLPLPAKRERNSRREECLLTADSCP
jgi:hypothetical protein